MESNSDFSPLRTMRRRAQINDFYCGPAVLQMLLSAHGVEVTQEAIKQAGMQRRIEDFGMVVEELALACTRLAPNLQFWYKSEANVEDLARVVEEFHHPVGVEWQGLFKPKHQDEDNGHYGVVVSVDTANNAISLVDPFYYGPEQEERRFRIAGFVKRWWDTNETINHETGRRDWILDHRLMFVVTLRGAKFPEEIEMVKAN